MLLPFDVAKDISGGAADEFVTRESDICDDAIESLAYSIGIMQRDEVFERLPEKLTARDAQLSRQFIGLAKQLIRQRNGRSHINSMAYVTIVCRASCFFHRPVRRMSSTTSNAASISSSVV